MKKLLAAVFALILGMGALSVGFAPTATASAATETKTIDMYLIAGQSNAAGYSSKPSLPTGQFNNIMYAGQTDRVMSTGKAKSERLKFSDFATSVTAGLGREPGYIGPEYGIAKVLNDQYTPTDKAIIFKSAAGGTALQDSATGDGSKAYGNWYPRSLWESGYTPNTAAGNTDPTGVQYMMFLENFTKVYNELKANGYTPVVKGMAWMQGEEDMGIDASNYNVHLTALINDLRQDLFQITGDYSLEEMPFVCGHIATSFAIPNNPGAPIINGKMDLVASQMTNVKTVDTADLIIVNPDKTINGTDAFHFNTTDAEKLGERFGNQLLTMTITNADRVVLSTDGGTAEWEYDEAAGKITLKNFTPNSGYALSTIALQGVDGQNKVLYTSSSGALEGGTYTVNVSDYPTVARFRFVIKFMMAKYKLNITNDTSMGTVTPNKGLQQTVGTVIRLTIATKENYTLKKVTFNGSEVTANADGKYYVTIVAGENNLVVEYNVPVVPETPPVVSPETPTEPTEQGGCGGEVSVFGGVAMLLTAVAAVTVVRRKLQK